MEEEVVEAEVVNETPAVENTKPSLVAFILACVSLAVSTGWLVGSVAAIITGAMALKRLKNSDDVRKQPFRVFRRIAKPVAIVGIIVGAIMIPVWIFYMATVIAAAIAGAAGAGA